MKILDILSEASYFVDDGTRAENEQTMNDYLDYIRASWLRAKRQHGAEDEQKWVNELVSKSQKYMPAANTLGIGPWRRQALLKYGNAYHFDDDAWEKGATGRNSQRSGAEYDATDTQLELQSRGGEDGNLGDRAAFQNVRDKVEAARGGEDIQAITRARAQGKNSSKTVDPYQTTPRFGSQQYQLDKDQAGTTPEEQEGYRKEIANDKGEVSERRAAWQAAKEAKKVAKQVRPDAPPVVPAEGDSQATINRKNNFAKVRTQRKPAD